MQTLLKPLQPLLRLAQSILRPLQQQPKPQPQPLPLKPKKPGPLQMQELIRQARSEMSQRHLTRQEKRKAYRELDNLERKNQKAIQQMQAQMASR